MKLSSFVLKKQLYAAGADNYLCFSLIIAKEKKKVSHLSYSILPVVKHLCVYVKAIIYGAVVYNDLCFHDH